MAKGAGMPSRKAAEGANRLCVGCARGCKQGPLCVVVSCPRHVPLPAGRNQVSP